MLCNFISHLLRRPKPWSFLDSWLRFGSISRDESIECIVFSAPKNVLNPWMMSKKSVTVNNWEIHQCFLNSSLLYLRSVLRNIPEKQSKNTTQAVSVVTATEQYHSASQHLTRTVQFCVDPRVKGPCRDQQSWGECRRLVEESQSLSAHGAFTPWGLSCCFWVALALAGMVAPAGWSAAKYVGLKDKT